MRKAYVELFRQGRIGKLELPNRLVMPPMETHYSGKNGEVTNRQIAYYEERARGGVGLIIVEAISVDFPRGNTVRDNLALDRDELIGGMASLTAAIKRHGVFVAAQLFHAGAEAHSRITGIQPVGPSLVKTFRGDCPRELSTEEISILIKKFADAGARAKKAGFDGVEIHGATYYLIAQFLSRHWNRRNDLYGGSLENRARFLIETIRAVKTAVGEDFPVWCRINGTEFGLDDGFTLEEAKVVARLAEEAGSDAIHVSSFGGGSQPHMGPTVSDHGILIPIAREIKKGVHVPVIAVGRIDPSQGEKALLNGHADFIAIGRGLIVDPELPRKLKEGREAEIRPCIGCLECINQIIYRESPLRCSVNPLCGFEGEVSIEPAQEPKRVAIIGGGPGGMEAARVASMRGHRVSLYEKGERLGGLLVSASLPPGKKDISRLLAYFERELERLGVEIHMGLEMTPEKVEALMPDAVILACGASHVVPDIPGIEGKDYITAEEAILKREAVGERVLIIGGGLVGCETADYFSEMGRFVSVVRRSSRMASDMVPILRRPLMDRLRQKGVRLFVEVKDERLEGDRFHFRDKDGKECSIEFDTLVIAAGGIPGKERWEGLRSKIPQVYFVGDMAEPRGGIMEAIAGGNNAGRSV